MESKNFDELRELAEHSPDGLTRLEAIPEFTKYWTQVLVTAVALARSQGASWKEVGVALGVSPQAAHQRFKVRVIPHE